MLLLLPPLLRFCRMRNILCNAHNAPLQGPAIFLSWHSIYSISGPRISLELMRELMAAGGLLRLLLLLKSKARK